MNRAWEPTMFYCAGCRSFRDNPNATAKDERGEWRRIYHGAEDRPCSEQCAALLSTR